MPAHQVAEAENRTPFCLLHCAHGIGRTSFCQIIFGFRLTKPSADTLHLAGVPEQNKAPLTVQEIGQLEDITVVHPDAAATGMPPNAPGLIGSMYPEGFRIAVKRDDDFCHAHGIERTAGFNSLRQFASF